MRCSHPKLAYLFGGGSTGYQLALVFHITDDSMMTIEEWISTSLQRMCKTLEGSFSANFIRLATHGVKLYWGPRPRAPRCPPARLFLRFVCLASVWTGARVFSFALLFSRTWVYSSSWASRRLYKPHGNNAGSIDDEDLLSRAYWNEIDELGVPSHLLELNLSMSMKIHWNLEPLRVCNRVNRWSKGHVRIQSVHRTNLQYDIQTSSNRRQAYLLTYSVVAFAPRIAPRLAPRWFSTTNPLPRFAVGKQWAKGPWCRI